MARNENQESAFDAQVGYERYHTGIFAAIIAFYFVTRVILPTDLYSSAIWLQGFDRPTPWSAPPDDAISQRVFGFLYSIVPEYTSDGQSAREIGVEPITFSIVISLMQIMFTLSMHEQGPWIKGGDDRGRDQRSRLPFIFVLTAMWRNWRGHPGGVKPADLNGAKFAFLFLWLSFVLLDGITSVSYRMAAGTNSTAPAWVFIVVTICYAFILENLASEYIIGEGLRRILSVAAILLLSVPAIVNFFVEWTEKWTGLKNRARSGRQRLSGGGGGGQPQPPRSNQPRQEPRPQPPRGGGSGGREERPRQPAQPPMPSEEMRPEVRPEMRPSSGSILPINNLPSLMDIGRDLIGDG
jgi:hypothetical protein